MSFARPGITRVTPRPTGQRPTRAVHMTGPAGSTLAQQFGTWNFTAKVYVAWDPQSSLSPSWIEVTEFCEITDNSPIRIRRGRADSLSDPSAGTCTLTVDNTDGRWSPANPNGAWFGQIRKGAWLRVDVLPPSGTTSTRFVGYIQQLPVTWAGRYSSVQIQAADLFAPLANAPKYGTALFEEISNDPSGSVGIVGYWPLHEASGAQYVSDISGNAPAAQSTLTVYSQGVNPGTGISFGGLSAPGYDGESTVTFAPTGSNSFFGSPGPGIQGSYLQGNVGPNGNVAVVSCWINTTSTAYLPIWSWTDPQSNYGLWCGIMGALNGPLEIVQYPLNGVTTSIGNVNSISFGAGKNLTDGIWHQIVVKIQTPAALNGGPFAGEGTFLQVWIDGNYGFGYFDGSTPTSDIVIIPTLSRLTIGGAESWQMFNTGYLPTGQVSLFSGAISDVVVYVYGDTGPNPDWYGAYQAATTMWQAPNVAYPVPESCGRRVVRLASYAGIPTPTESFTPPNGDRAIDVAVGVTPFFNIPAETAHPAGFQQIVRSDPVTQMQTAAHTEYMPLFVDKQGRITLQPSTLRQNPVTAFTINGADLDKNTQFADDFQYANNQTVVTPSGQGSLTVNTNGAASQALNGVYSQSVASITVNALESGSLGAAYNAAGANPQPRHNPLQCEVATLATQTGIITPNPLFLSTFLPWQAFGGTGALSSAVTYQGAPSSGLLTPDGVSSQGFFQSGLSPAVTPGQTYTASGLLYSPVGYGNVAVSINWYTPAGGYLSTTSGTATALAAGTWTMFTASGAAPAGAGFAAAVAVEGGTPPVTALLYAYNLAVIDPLSAYGPSWYDAVLAAEISSVIGTVNMPAGSPGGSSGTYYIEGYDETVGQAIHTFAWNTSATQGATYQCDSATLGVIDTPGLTLAY
jgi:hypothetical protein